MSEFSNRLQALREEKGWSKTYVANKLGLARMQVYANYEYGTREPDFDTVKKLADLFSVSTDYLLGRPEEKKDERDLSIDEALGLIMSYDGKPVTDHDKLVMKSLLESYLKNKG